MPSSPPPPSSSSFFWGDTSEDEYYASQALHSGSEMLYEKAMTAKEDKALKLYEGMYHSLISGEPDENVDIVLADMKTWIDEQTQNCGPICADN
nr:caffeoylshikimate esterase-like [Tanacetum cinerariifolium]